jgi:hypothetical protein
MTNLVKYWTAQELELIRENHEKTLAAVRRLRTVARFMKALGKAGLDFERNRMVISGEKR